MISWSTREWSFSTTDLKIPYVCNFRETRQRALAEPSVLDTALLAAWVPPGSALANYDSAQAIVSAHSPRTPWGKLRGKSGIHSSTYPLYKKGDFVNKKRLPVSKINML